jgi:hypothetical protein
LALTDNEVMAAILLAARDPAQPGHDSARRIVDRDHFRLIYQRNPVDALVNPLAAEAVHEAACQRFGREKVRRAARRPKSEGVDFPVLTKDQRVESSLKMSDVLLKIPAASFDLVFIERGSLKDAETWLKDERNKIIGAAPREHIDGSPAA